MCAAISLRSAGPADSNSTHFAVEYTQAACQTLPESEAHRFFSYSNERDEPPHIHVRRERKVAKFWLGEVSLAKSRGFAAHELRELERMVVERRQELLRAWNEYNRS